MATPSGPIRVLSSPRHACLGCGGSCHGVRVRLLGDDERRIAELGARLEVREPVVDGHLRFDAGRCAFLDDGLRCRLHLEFGPAAKPVICRQYPTVVVQTEQGLRAGVDPGCYTAHTTWRHGPAVDVEAFGANRSELDAAQQSQEQAFLGLASSRGATVARLLQAMCTEATVEGPALPPGFAARWVTRLRAAPLAALVARPEAGDALRRGLAPLLELLPRLNPEDPPAWPVLSDEMDAWAVEVARRMVFLRVMSSLPIVQGVAMLSLGGALACAWSDPRPESFGPALAGWSRAIRAPAFWRGLIPDPETLRWLATGKR
jgi:Fe-S-cluster containining protein